MADEVIIIQQKQSSRCVCKLGSVWIFSPYWLLKNSREKEAAAAWNFYNPTTTMTPEELKLSNEEFEKLSQSAKEDIREKEIKLKQWG